MKNRFERAAGNDVRVSWNPQEGVGCPFEDVTDNLNIPVLHRGHKVVVMEGKYYKVSKSWWDYHPNLENGAILVPVREKI